MAAFTFQLPNGSSSLAFDAPPTPTPSRGNSRKRSRPTYDDGLQRASAAGAHATDWNSLSAASSIVRSADAPSPAPLVDTRYVLAAGAASPFGEDDAGDRYDRGDQGAHAQFRRRWDMSNSDPRHTLPAGEHQPSTSGMAAGLPEDLAQSPGWGKAVFNLVGGVAGKMWDFCKGTAFKGFYAGGGKGYDLPPGDQTQQNNLQTAQSIWEDLDSRTAYSNWDRSPMPGHFPEEPFSFTIERPQQQEDTPPRPSKRLHTETGSGWVMVSHPQSNGASPRPSTSSRLSISNKTSSPSQIPRPIIHSRAGAPAPTPTSTINHPRSLLPASRRSSLVSTTGSPFSRQSLPASSTTTVTTSTTSKATLHRTPHASPPARPRERQYTRESYDSPALLSPMKKGSPLSPDVQLYAARMRREEREADASMNRLGAQLAALIQEGQNALKSKPNVYDGAEDEGFAEGRW